MMAYPANLSIPGPLDDLFRENVSGNEGLVHVRFEGGASPFDEPAPEPDPNPMDREVVSVSVVVCAVEGCSRRMVVNKYRGRAGRPRSFCKGCKTARDVESHRASSARRRKAAAGVRECSSVHCSRDISNRHKAAIYCFPCAKARQKLSNACVAARGSAGGVEQGDGGGSVGDRVSADEVVELAEWAFWDARCGNPFGFPKSHLDDEDGEIEGYYPPAAAAAGAVGYRVVGRKFCRGKVGDLF